MITGFNTDIEYNGVVYHVQTEDKGLASPLILSLVYSGGAILASKRSPYEDLIASGFDEEALSQRLKRQHRLICAAINAGRIEELKQMGRAEGERLTEVVEEKPKKKAKKKTEVKVEAQVEEKTAEKVESAPELELEGEETDLTAEIVRLADPEIINVPLHELIVSNADDYAVIAEETPAPSSLPEPESEQPAVTVLPDRGTDESPYTIHDSRRQSPLGPAVRELGVIVTILDEEEFRAGQIFNIRVLVEHRTETGGRALSGVPLSVKILGTTFRPQLYSVKTGKDGVAVISAQIPRFTSGRAAILIHADAEGKAIEIRRVIHAAL